MMVPEAPKRRLFEALASVGRALGHKHRLALIEHLGQGERAVEGLAERLGLSVANTSQHLQQMRRAGLVSARRDGRHIFYRLADPQVIEAVTAMRRIAEQSLSEIEQVTRTYFTSLDAMQPVSRSELFERLSDGTATLLDVRPEDEFRQGHLPGALNITLLELERRLAKLPPDREIIAYCRGPYCLLSFEAVKMLRSHGFTVRRLEDGFPEWKAAGLPVEEGSAA